MVTLRGRAVCYGDRYTETGLEWDKSKVRLSIYFGRDSAEDELFEVPNLFPSLKPSYDVEVEWSRDQVVSWRPRLVATVSLGGTIPLTPHQWHSLRQLLGDKASRALDVSIVADVDKDGEFFNLRIFNDTQEREQEQTGHSGGPILCPDAGG
jgi:hypothetical protein